MHECASPPLSCSLIISTYNWPDALNLVLKSISTQIMMPTEVIIADDGSRPDTKELIDRWKPNLPVPLIHVWQEDNGFQLAKIRNKAITKATGDYLISIDGDMVLSPYFVIDHLQFAKPNTFVQGGRVIVSQQKSAEAFEHQELKLNFLTSGISNRKNALRLIPLAKLISYFETTKLDRIRGCNQAFWRHDLLKVNGFNEAMVGWGREDSELAVRLFNSGVKRRNLKFAAPAYHLYHKENNRDRLNENDQLLKDAIQNSAHFCDKGISQYS